jgi:hypothetical protein
MPKTKLNIIKPFLAVTEMPDGDVLSRLNAAHDGLFNNPAYPNPPVAIVIFKAAIEAYTAAAADALHDGGKRAIEERNKRRADAILIYLLLGHYVEGACKGEMNTFVSSGFAAAPTGQRTPPQPVSVPRIVLLDQGHTGQLLVTIKPVPKALHYEIRHAVVPAAGATVNWTTILVTSTKPPTAVNNLTPGTSYTFQARAFGRLGYSDWSAAVDRMCI